MGMYTEVLVKARLSNEAAKDDLIISVIRYLFSGGEKPETLPEHDFFKTDRWDHIGNSCSFYHHPAVICSHHNEYGGNYIFSRSDLKNYDGEVQAFFDWLKPFCDAEPGECIGYSWYEEELAPTLIFKD